LAEEQMEQIGPVAAAHVRQITFLALRVRLLHHAGSPGTYVTLPQAPPPQWAESAGQAMKPQHSEALSAHSRRRRPCPPGPPERLPATPAGLTPSGHHPRLCSVLSKWPHMKGAAAASRLATCPRLQYLVHALSHLVDARCVPLQQGRHQPVGMVRPELEGRRGKH
jgi:hypothetical protein